MHRIAWLVLMVLAAGLVAAPMVQADDWKLVWADEFDQPGAPDPSKWGYEEGFIRNQEAQYYTSNRRANARVENGVLVLEAHKERWANPHLRPGEPAYAGYTSASLTTRNTATWTYGRIESRLKMPSGRGVWPAFWMLGANIDQAGWPDCGEIDIMENVGFEPDVNHGSIHCKAFNWMLNTQETATVPVPKATSEYHVYAIDWEPDDIQFSVDQQPYLTFHNPGTGAAAWPYDKPFFIILNMAIGGQWGGQHGIDENVFPARMEVDYVRVYQRLSR